MSNHHSVLHSSAWTCWPTLMYLGLWDSWMSLVRPRLYHSTCGLARLISLHRVGVLLHPALVIRLIVVVTQIRWVVMLTIWLLNGGLQVLVPILMMLTTVNAWKRRLPNLRRNLVVLKESLSNFLRVHHSSRKNTCVRVNHNIVGQILRLKFHLEFLDLGTVFAVYVESLLKTLINIMNTY
jgi:hypothetical protein